MTPSSRMFRVALLAVVALALFASACTSSSTTTTEAETTTTTDAQPDESQQSLVFGNGEVPETMPDSFPIPETGVIGATMIDRTRSLTEVVMTLPANVPEAVTFYETNLEALGWTVVSSAGTDAAWFIEFEGAEGTGDVDLKTGGAGLTQSVIRFTSVDG